MTNKQNSQNIRIQVNPDISSETSAFLVGYTDHIALNDIPVSTTIPLLALNTVKFIEQWTGSLTRISTDDDMAQAYTNEDYLFAAAPISLVNTKTIEHATQVAYTEIFEQIKAHGYPHLIRTWNFFPDIHIDRDHTNNYKLFCSGRAHAYAQDETLSSPYPAATVIGTQQSGLFIYYIASKHAGIGIENSQQVSAFEYPSNYSIDPPLFSRALLHKTAHQEILYISGTASITGHQTQHRGDVGKQLALCISNIEHLLITASRDHQFPTTTFCTCNQIKVYLNDPSHLPVIEPLLQERVKQGAKIYYFHGDMCRDDLLVEIEALAIHDKD